jgi:hypothetical protein
MLKTLLLQTEVDILFLQEVTHPNLDAICGYTTHYNVGTAMRGTALVKRDGNHSPISPNYRLAVPSPLSSEGYG